METQDLHKDDNLYKDYIDTVDSITGITNSKEVLTVVEEYLKDFKGSDAKDCRVVIATFLRLFQVMRNNIAGSEIHQNDIETLFMGESMMLELNNSWYRKVKPILDPVMAQCKTSMVTALMVKGRPESHPSDQELINNLMVASWEFIPWMLFLITADLKTFIASKELFTRMVINSLGELTG